MAEFVLILTLLLPNGADYTTESEWLSLDDCQRAAVRLVDYFAPSEYRTRCEYVPPKP